MRALAWRRVFSWLGLALVVWFVGIVWKPTLCCCVIQIITIALSRLLFLLGFCSFSDFRCGCGRHGFGLLACSFVVVATKLSTFSPWAIGIYEPQKKLSTKQTCIQWIHIYNYIYNYIIYTHAQRISNNIKSCSFPEHVSIRRGDCSSTILIFIRQTPGLSTSFGGKNLKLLLCFILFYSKKGRAGLYGGKFLGRGQQWNSMQHVG